MTNEAVTVNWNDRKKRRWAFLLYKRLELITEEVELTKELLLNMGTPASEQLDREFKLNGENKVDKWINS